jgi:hypothetical protein
VRLWLPKAVHDRLLRAARKEGLRDVRAYLTKLATQIVAGEATGTLADERLLALAGEALKAVEAFRKENARLKKVSRANGKEGTA